MSPFSYSFSLFISSSCSLSFPNNIVVLKVVRSLVSKIIVTFGCQVLSRHFKILMLSSSVSKIFLRPMRWFTMSVNLLCTCNMVSPGCILNNSYSLMRVCFLVCFTSHVPSEVTSKMSHIFIAKEHCDALKKLVQIQSWSYYIFYHALIWAFLLPISFHLDQGLSTISLFIIVLHRTHHDQLIQWNFHFDFPKRTIDPTD